MRKTTRLQLYTKAEVLILCLQVMRADGVSLAAYSSKIPSKTTYHLTSYLLIAATAPNDNIYCTATSLAGPWSAWADFATAGTNTFSSQTAAVVNINGVIM